MSDVETGPSYGLPRRLATYESDDAPPRSECVGAERPCERVCRYRLDSPNATCALDVAELGGITLEEAGEILGVTRERVRQIEAKAIRKLTRAIRLGGGKFADMLPATPTTEAP